MSKKEDLQKIVGPEQVLDDPDVLQGFQTDNDNIAGHPPACVVKPHNAEQVQQVVALANEQGWPLVPVSSRGERARGDTVPFSEGAVIMDLSDMKAVVRVDRRNKVAMVEPGVTFETLIAAVEKEGLRVEMPLSPRQGKSVLASLLDREPTTAPKYNWDACDPLCCLEVIFGSGDLFRTGNAAGPGTLEEQWAAGQAQKVSMGPAQTDIGRLIQGAQGTLGIATWGTIKLELQPALRKGFLVGAEEPEALIDFAYKLLWRKLPDVCLLLNRYDLAAIYGVEAAGLPAWVLVYSLSGLEYLPEERLQYMEADIAGLAKSFAVAPVRHMAGVSGDKLVDRITRPAEDIHWKSAPRGGCRDLFFLTTLDRAPEFIRAVTAEAAEHGLAAENLGVYLQPVRHGTGCHVEFSFFYDPGDAEQGQQLSALLDSALTRCLDLGAFFSRPHVSWAGPVYDKCPDTARALQKIKAIFDPANVLNPGKLCFGKEA